MAKAVKDVRQEKEALAERNTKLISTFIALVFIGLGNKSGSFVPIATLRTHFVYDSLPKASDYSDAQLPDVTQFIDYIPVSFAYIIPMIKYGSSITVEQRRIPKRSFAIMGSLDSLAGILQIFAATYLSGSLLILLGQAAIPVSMVMSAIWLNRQYTSFQYLGAIIVTFGLIIVLGPSLSLRACESSLAGAQDLHLGSSFSWAIVMIVSCIPMCLSSVYKEKALGEAELDAIYLNGWVALYQFIVTLPLTIPIAMIGDPPIPPSQLLSNLRDGFQCYLGHNSIQYGPDEDDCSQAPIYVNLYLFFNILYNILIILLIKFGSVNVLYLAMTIMVPLGNVAFTFSFMPGHEPLAAKDIVGLIVIMMGLFTYRFLGDIIATTRRPWTIRTHKRHFDKKDLASSTDSADDLTKALITQEIPSDRTIVDV